VARLGGIASGLPLPAWVARSLAPPAGDGAEAYRQRLQALAAQAGIPSSPLPLASLDAAAVRRYVAAAFDLALDARLFVAPADLPYLVASPPPEWSEEDRRLAALFVKVGLAGDLATDLAPPAREELLYRLAVYLRVVRRDEGSYLGLADGRLQVRIGDEVRQVPIPARLATFRVLGDDGLGADLALVPGDRVEVLYRGQEPIALVQHVHPQGVASDRTSRFASWQRFKSDAELLSLVRQRYPGFPYSSFEVLDRGVSGRVGSLKLLGSDGRSEVVEGLAVRWTLDLPDTLFTARRLTPNKGAAGWLFTGRGWGHGVGLCQVGAYGMAMRGHGYRAILGHYYRGVRVGGIPAAAAASSVVGLWVPDATAPGSAAAAVAGGAR
jgi:stage II sporulation protein D